MSGLNYNTTSSIAVALVAILLLLVGLCNGRAVTHKDGFDTFTSEIGVGRLHDGNQTLLLFGDTGEADPTTSPDHSLTEEEGRRMMIRENLAPRVKLQIEDGVVVRVIVLTRSGHLAPFRLRISTEASLFNDDADAMLLEEITQDERRKGHVSEDSEDSWDDDDDGSTTDVSRRRREEHERVQDRYMKAQAARQAATMLDVSSDHNITDTEVPFPAKIQTNYLGNRKLYLRVDLFVRRMSAFQYTMSMRELEEGVPQDLIPPNASMGIRFVARVDRQKRTLGIWVKRKPPVPPFIMRVYNVLLRQENESLSSTGVINDNPHEIAGAIINNGTILDPDDELTLKELVSLRVQLPHPHGTGFDDVLAAYNAELAEFEQDRKDGKWTEEMEENLVTVKSINNLAIRIRVEFDEMPREHHHMFKVENAESMLAQLKLDDGAYITYEPHIDTGFVETIDEDDGPVVVSPDGGGESAADSLHALYEETHALEEQKRRRRETPQYLRCRLQHFSLTTYISLTILQKVPIRRLQVHVVDADNHTLFLEEEMHVPFMSDDDVERNVRELGRGMAFKDMSDSENPAKRLGAHNMPLHFGWFYFLPIDGAHDKWRKMTGNQFTVHVFFDLDKRYDEEERVDGPLRGEDKSRNLAIHQLREWMTMHACDVEKLWIGRSRRNGWRMETYLPARWDSEVREIQAGETVATVPMPSVITRMNVQRVERVNDLKETDTWGEMLANWTEKGRGGFVSNKEADIVEMTIFLACHPEDPSEGKRFEAVHDALFTSQPSIGFVNTRFVFPALLAEDFRTLAPAGMSPLVEEMLNELQLFRDEYEVLKEERAYLIPKLSWERYLYTRVAVGSALSYDANGEPFLVPLLHYADHDDDPSVVLRHTNRGPGGSPQVELVARRQLKDGDAITVDWAASRRTNIGYWLARGETSRSSNDVAVVAGVVLGARDKGSLRHLIDTVEKDMKSSAAEGTTPSTAEVLEAALKMIEDAQSQLPRSVPHNHGQSATLQYPPARSRIISGLNELLLGAKRALTAHKEWLFDMLEQQ